MVPNPGLKETIKAYFQARPFQWTSVDNPWQWVKVHGFPAVTSPDIEGILGELVRERWLAQSQTGKFAYLEGFKRL